MSGAGVGGGPMPRACQTIAPAASTSRPGPPRWIPNGAHGGSPEGRRQGIGRRRPDAGPPVAGPPARRQPFGIAHRQARDARRSLHVQRFRCAIGRTESPHAALIDQPPRPAPPARGAQRTRRRPGKRTLAPAQSGTRPPPSPAGRSHRQPSQPSLWPGGVPEACRYRKLASPRAPLAASRRATETGRSLIILRGLAPWTCRARAAYLCQSLNSSL